MHINLSMKKFATLVTGLAPIILMTVGVPPEVSALVIHAIINAENLGGPGEDKKNDVIAAARQGANDLNAAAGKVVVDPTQVVEAVSDGIDAVISTVNLVHNTPVHHAPAVPPDQPPSQG